MIGRTVLHYQFLEKLGSGGMGDIYKAVDTRLNRFVAVKVLTSSASGDPERRRRFIQEAQAASALNHPNIITIHDIVSEGDTEFMVMEYVTGKTLVDLIPKGGLRVPQVLKYSVQMADALQAAHSHGIVHRDLKPANVMVTDSGLVKILDFGLAKLTDRGPLTAVSGAQDVTRTIADSPLTVEGSIIGTVSYMSPEQAQGKKVDTRSDIFSFGVVLYEMVTGARAFEGDSALTTLSAILRDDVRPVAEFTPEAPPQMEMVIQRCLRKQPDDRWQTMQDVLMALSALKHESDSGTLYRARLAQTGAVPTRTAGVSTTSAAAVPRRSGPGVVLMGIVGGTIALVIAAGGSIWWTRHKAAAALQQAAAAEPPPAPGPEAAPPPAPTDAPMSNDDVLKLVAAKVPTEQILAQIANAKSTSFVLSTDAMIELNNAHVPSILQQAMRNPEKAAQLSSALTPAPGTAPAAAHATPAKQVQPQTPTVVNANAPSPAPAAPQLPPLPAPPPPPASPQPATQQAAVTPPGPSAAPKVSAPPKSSAGMSLSDGTALPIKLAQDIPADAPKGAPVKFTVSSDVAVGGKVVIPTGTTVTGEIVQEHEKRTIKNPLPKPMAYKLNSVEIAGQPLKVRADQKKGSNSRLVSDQNGKEKVKPTKTVEAPADTEYTAYIDGDQAVTAGK